MRGESQYHQFIQRYFQATPSIFQEKKGISANYIELRYLNMELVSEFLDWLETSRHIAVTTRNQRLAAIKAFAHFVQYKFPENIENCVDIINLRPKKYEKALIPF